MATWIIKNSFAAWEEHPVVTSVMQKSIEEINFPAITICPLDDTRFGYLEKHLNSQNSGISVENLVTDLAKVLYARHPKASENDCLMSFCEEFLVKVKNGEEIKDEFWDISNETAENYQNCEEFHCPKSLEFRRFFATIQDLILEDLKDPDRYHNFILDQFSVQNRSINHDEWKRRAKTTPLPLGGEICNFKTSVSCHKLVADFRFLIAFRQLILSSDRIFKDSKTGSLLKMLLTQMEDDPDLQREVFLHYVSNETFPKLFAKHWLRRQDLDGELPLHDLIALVANREDGFDRSSSVFDQQVLLTTN